MDTLHGMAYKGLPLPAFLKPHIDSQALAVARSDHHVIKQPPGSRPCPIRPRCTTIPVRLPRQPRRPRPSLALNFRPCREPERPPLQQRRRIKLGRRQGNRIPRHVLQRLRDGNDQTGSQRGRNPSCSRKRPHTPLGQQLQLLQEVLWSGWHC